MSDIDNNVLNGLRSFTPPFDISKEFNNVNEENIELNNIDDITDKIIGKRGECFLTFADKNTKLDHPLFSLPAGHTCPYAEYCKTLVPRDREKTHNTLIKDYGELRCYAANAETQYPATQASRWRNKDLLDLYPGVDGKAKLIINSIAFYEYVKEPMTLLRVHESGDFYHLDYFDAWLKVAKFRPDILFYAYTKSLPFWIQRQKEIPPNFKFVASYGGQYDEYITKYKLRYAKVFDTYEELLSSGLELNIDDTLAYNTDANFALLLHGTQKKGTLKAKQAYANAKILKRLKHEKKLNKLRNKIVNEGYDKKMKLNPRNWSSKYWSKKSVSDMLKEVIEPEAVDVSSIQMNDELSPLIWDSDNLKPDVRKTLLLNAKRFIEFCDMENMKFSDIMLTGSMANYNYNENSDIDVHIIMDFSQISTNKEFVGDFFKIKKQLWAENLPIKIKGHDVEMYFQDVNDPHHSTGTYSIIDNEWILKPIKKIININSGAVQLKAADLMNAIDDLETNKNKKDFLKKHKILKDKIKKYRQSGLEKGGEYSVENLAFKILRNSGYLKRMMDIKNDYLTQELSLDEFLNPDM
jgi:hypothetical protein